MAASSSRSDIPTDLRSTLSVVLAPGGRIVFDGSPTDAVSGEGVEELWEAVRSHRDHLGETGLLAKRRASNLARQVYALASGRAKAHLERAVAGDEELRRLLELVERRELDPLSAVREIMQKVFRIES